MKKDPRILLMTDQLGNLKPAQSFSALMKQAEQRNENFIFFADQDDVWLPNKLQLGVEVLEKENNDTPLLVFSDLCVVDAELNKIHPSYLQYENLKPYKKIPLKTLLIHNYITGCTIGMNRALLKFASPVPETAVMHDWWCALCAATIGNIVFIEQATILYRQHSQNDIGSKGFYHKFKNLRSIKKSLNLRIEQAKNVLQRVPKTNPHWNTIDTFVSLPQASFSSKIEKLSHLKLKTDGYIRQWGFLFLLFSMKKQ